MIDVLLYALSRDLYDDVRWREVSRHMIDVYIDL